MASQEEMERLVGKGIFDVEFREYILREPEAAAKSVGIELDADQVEAVQQLDQESITALAVLFSKEAIWTPNVGNPNFPWWRARNQLRNPGLPIT